MFRDAKPVLGLVLLGTGLGVAAIYGGSLWRSYVHSESLSRAWVLVAAAGCFAIAGGAMAIHSFARATPAVSKSRRAWSAVSAFGVALVAAVLPIIFWGWPGRDLTGVVYVLHCMVAVPVVSLPVFAGNVRQDEPQSVPANAERPPAYRVLLKVATFLGAFLCPGGVLWLMCGAGIFGSPVSGAFTGDTAPGAPHHWEFWIFWIVVAGPIGLLLYAVLEWLCPRVGAAAMVAAAMFVAEAAIRSARLVGGFSDGDADVVILYIAWPLLLLGVSLLAVGSRRSRRQVTMAVVVGLLVAMVAIAARYTMVKARWNWRRAEVRRGWRGR